MYQLFGKTVDVRSAEGMVQSKPGTSFCAREQGRNTEISGLYQKGIGASMKDIPMTSCDYLEHQRKKCKW